MVCRSDGFFDELAGLAEDMRNDLEEKKLRYQESTTLVDRVAYYGQITLLETYLQRLINLLLEETTRTGGPY